MVMLELIRLFTSLFVVFTAYAFAYQAFHNSKEASDSYGNTFCSVMMVLAFFFMWR